MSWYRQVKILYTTTLTVFFFIMWGFIEKILFQRDIKYLLIIMTLISVFLMQYLIHKKINKYLSVSVPLIISTVVLYFISKDLYIIVDLIFLAAVMIFNLSMENDTVNYYQCKRNLINGLYLIVPIGAIAIILKSTLVIYLFRAYMFYLILMIITFRESLRYTYNIRNKSSIYINLGILLGIIGLCQEYLFNAFKKIITWIGGIFSFITEGILTVLIKILEKPIESIVSALRRAMSKNKILENMLENLEGKEKSAEFIYEESTFRYPMWSKILVLILIIYFLYKIIYKVKINVKVNEDYIEYTESISEKNEGKKPRYISTFMKKLFRKKGNIREEILYTYENFERITSKADIYRPYMTATQLKNVTKIKVDSTDGLDDMTDIYNKAKFSIKELSEENLQKVKDSYKNIKKQI
ncbi:MULTISPECIES: hypothetical protein [Clostridium]|uniref:DUF4129 domain-containing protein n=1 Tax=Clostridium faecium TaxID=2762223 RepID=A0ABR8YU14_9CLOT|nr:MULTISPECIES: hypothetical protein [Clostridium]MBD8047720.1 hypothetical protein [Clostridium faecium]MDU1348064.1 hypothetical protein [Clostridium argentinense]